MWQKQQSLNRSLNKKAVEMAKQEPNVRNKNFSEVALGYTEAEAQEEASRCLLLPKPQCRTGCPVEVPIPQFIKCIKEKKYAEGIQIIKTKNALPAVCGRVCPQEVQCQAKCVIGKMGDPVSIGRLERFLADWERENGAATATKSCANRQKSRSYRCRPSRLNRCSRPRQTRTRNHHVRSPTHRRRSPLLRYPRIPSTQKPS